MCGIAGIRPQKPTDPALLEASVRGMIDALVHRGPDEEGVYVTPEIGLGSRRLKIIGLDDGRMPICNETGSVWVVYNGEIYNFAELRRELEDRGHRFRTHADTEVLVHLYEEHGIDFVERLVGMFAFALWDAEAEALFLVRDRLGIKPLFYREDGPGLVFASELKGLYAVADREPELDLESLAEYLSLGYIRAPRTIHRAYAKLPPGCVLEHRRGHTRINAYWRFPNTVAPVLMDEHEAADELEALLRTAVRDRLIADVPLGAFLSGGIDSSLVVALAAQECSGRLKTFSVGFGEADELPYAREVAERYGTEHHELILQPEDCRMLDTVLEAFDEPFGDDSAVPTYFVSEFARRHVTVALSGDGGDELFAGYDQYAHDARWAWLDRVPSAARRAAFGWTARLLPAGVYGWNRLRSLAASRAERFTLFRTQELNPALGGLLSRNLRSLVKSDVFSTEFADAAALPDAAKLLYVDSVTYLPDDILAKVDRMSMAVSLESRVPVLDHRVVEFVAGLPIDWKLRGRERKRLLRRVGTRHLPPDVLTRKKQGFSLPMQGWMKREIGDMLDVLSSERAESRQYLHGPSVTRLLVEHRRGRRDHAEILWRLVVLEAWLRRGTVVRPGTAGIPGPRPAEPHPTASATSTEGKFDAV